MAGFEGLMSWVVSNGPKMSVLFSSCRSQWKVLPRRPIQKGLQRLHLLPGRHQGPRLVHLRPLPQQATLVSFWVTTQERDTNYLAIPSQILTNYTVHSAISSSNIYQYTSVEESHNKKIISKSTYFLFNKNALFSDTYRAALIYNRI